MGSTLEGTLTYGFDLGGVEDEWYLKGLNEDEGWKPSWATPEELASEDGFDYDGGVSAQLFAAELDLQVVTYGMHAKGFTGFVLAAWTATNSGSRTMGVDLTDVLARREIERWDEALAKALEVLDIRPWQPNPLFLLTQSYG